MWYIIGIIIVIMIVGGIISWIVDLVDEIGILPIIVTVVVIIILSVFKLWPLALGFAAISAVIYIIISKIGDQVKEHDESKRKTAQINQKTQADKQMHNNDAALIGELSKNCYWLGYMNDDMWIKKLPNYVGRQYSTDFKTITSNFAKQVEQQHILQNDDWFEPFKLYVLNHPGGSTVTKMLHEVNCPQLKMTHCTPDGDLVNTWLVRRTKKANKDVPALFSSTFIKEVNESVFTPTPYLQKLYGENNSEIQDINHATEISFDDL